METHEVKTRVHNGWMMLVVLLLVFISLCYGGFLSISHVAAVSDANGSPGVLGVVCVLAAALGLIFWFVLMFGFFTLQPNMAAVMILFGKYVGTVDQSGFHWANPLLSKKKVSLRAHNLAGDTLKVNDSRGNPIEISLVVVWRVTNTAKAAFDVEDYEDYIRVQSEAALRHLAMAYPYDTFEDETLSLRGSVDEISVALEKEVQERATNAGIEVQEARISHLAYAPEIAGAMLQRQQADAIVAARQRIVEGAVGMSKWHWKNWRRTRPSPSTRSERPRWSATYSSCCAAKRQHNPS